MYAIAACIHLVKHLNPVMGSSSWNALYNIVYMALHGL